jgi:ribonuclease P/MRP protein subunit RPP1
MFFYLFFNPFLTIQFASVSILGLPQDSAHEASTKVPKSLIARARKLFFFKLLYTQHLYIFIYLSGSSTIETRKTYRAVLSEPKLVIPHGDVATHATRSVTEEETPLPLPTSTSTSYFENSIY